MGRFSRYDSTNAESKHKKDGNRLLWAEVLNRALQDAFFPQKSLSYSWIGLEWFEGEDCKWICEQLDLDHELLVKKVTDKGLKRLSTEELELSSNQCNYTERKRRQSGFSLDDYMLAKEAVVITQHPRKSLLRVFAVEQNIDTVVYQSKTYYKRSDIYKHEGCGLKQTGYVRKGMSGFLAEGARS